MKEVWRKPIKCITSQCCTSLINDSEAFSIIREQIFSFLYFYYNTEVISILTSTTPDGINSSTQYSIFCQHSQVNFIAQKHSAIFFAVFFGRYQIRKKESMGFAITFTIVLWDANPGLVLIEPVNPCVNDWHRFIKDVENLPTHYIFYNKPQSTIRLMQTSNGGIEE